MNGPTLAWVGVALCFALHLALAAWGLGTDAPQTYVLTPYIEVMPGAAPLDAESAARLQQELKGPVDARNIKDGYAWLGSTLSLQDLVSGINHLETAGLPLNEAQRARILPELEATRHDYEEMRAVQREILDLERRLDQDIQAVLQSLPPEQRQQVEARMRSPR